MSRILRRPLFRGGSANEGVMSVPRKGYQVAGLVDEDDDIIETVASSQGDTSRDKMLQQLFFFLLFIQYWNLMMQPVAYDVAELSFYELIVLLYLFHHHL